MDRSTGFRHRTALLILLLMLAVTVIPKESVYSDLPVADQILLILTTLRYNGSFVESLKSAATIKLGLLCGGTEEGEAYQERILSVFRQNFKRKTFYGLPIQIEKIDGAEGLKQHDIHALLIGPGVDDSIPEILDVTAQKNVISTTGITRYLNSGISIIVGLKENKKFLGINLESTKRENWKFSASIMQLAVIVDSDE